MAGSIRLLAVAATAIVALAGCSSKGRTPTATVQVPEPKATSPRCMRRNTP